MESRAFTVRHCMVHAVQSSTSGKAVALAYKRLGHFLAKKWLDGNMELKDAQGHIVRPCKDFSAVSDEDVAQMKSMAGVYEAYVGSENLAKLELGVVEQQGSSLTISGAVLSCFAGSPANIKAELDSLVDNFNDNHSERLKGILAKTSREVQSAVDPRTSEPREVEDAQQAAESESNLRASMTVVVDCKAADNRKVTLVGSEAGDLYLVSKD